MTQLDEASRQKNAWAHTAMNCLATWPRIMGAGVVALALLVLCGWTFGLQSLMRISPHFVAMNPIVAVGFLLSGACLLILSWRGGAPSRRVVAARVLAGIVLFLGASKLLAVAGGPDLGLDKILFRTGLDTLAAVHDGTNIFPNRMATNTAVLFLLAGAALLGATSTRLWMRRAAKFVALIAAFAASVAAVGYLNGVASLYQATASIPIALHTIFGFLAVSTGVLALDLGLSRSAATRAADDADPAAAALEAKITIGFGAALFLLAVIGLVSYASIQYASAAASLSEHTRQVTASIAQLSATLADAETGTRGFVITGDQRFLEPYQHSNATASAQLDDLRTLTRTNPAQQEQIALLAPLMDRQFALLQQLIDDRTTPSATQPRQLDTLNQSRQTMDDIRGHLGAMHQTAEDQQAVRSRDTASSNDVTRWIIAAGSALGLVLVGLAGWMIRRDLAERQRLDAALRRARRAADDANASKSQFLANMSHEIRTPMSAIIGYTDLVLDQRQSPSDRLDHINTIRRNGEHLLTIVNDILDLSKIEAGKLVVECVECCPCQILADVASLMRVRAVEKLIRLEVKNEGLVPATIKTDPARLRQILINLVGNAIKFTEEGWVRLIMRLDEPAAGPGRLRFDIIDTGIGMTREQVAQLFQPFVQVDDSMTRRFGGSGLGLTISLRLATMLGGRIDVDSSPGRGSTFTVTIDPGSLAGVQRLKNCREALAGQSPNMPREKASTVLRGRVLLVDDGPDNRRLLSVYLRDAGAEVTLAENGRLGCDEALAAVANGQPYGVILMDMQMPELDGYGAAARLRSKNHDGPIIALTAHAMAEDRDKCLKAGCTDYLSKPVRRDDLLLMVAKYMPAVEIAPPSAGTLPAPSTAPAPHPAPLESNLSDAGLREFLETYVQELPTRVAELEACLARDDLNQLSRHVHNLKGTGGLYGLMPITDAAARVERLLNEKAPVDFIATEAKGLIELIRSVKGYQPAEKPSSA